MIKFSEFLIVEQALAEVLSKDADSSEWIADFVKSDNPKFKGKSKAERIKMALGAYYAKQRNEEVELDEAKEFTPKFDFRKKVQPNINAHLDDDKVAGAHTSITYHKQPTGEIHAHVSYRNISGRSSTGVGPEKHMKFLVNKDYSVTKMNEEVELDEGIKSMVHSYLAKRAGKKADDAYDMGDEKEFQKQVDKSEYHRVKAGGKPTRINKNPDSKWLTTREEVEINESVKIIDRDSDLDQEHFKLSVNGKPVHFVHHNYEGSHATDSKQDIHYQVKTQLKHLSDADKKKITDTVHASYRMKEEFELDEAIKLNSKVTIHDPGKSHHGKVGYVGEIRHGAYKGAPKTYTVDYDHNEETGRSKSIQLDKKNIKQVKEEVGLDEAEDWELKKIHGEYKHLKSLPTSEVLKKHKAQHRVSAHYSAAEMGGKEGLISDIMRNRHGQKRMDAYHALPKKHKDALSEDIEQSDTLLEYPSDLAKMKKADSYKVGDKIWTKVGGKWHRGHITTPLNKAGNHGVKFQHNGKTHSYVSSPDQLRLNVEEVEYIGELSTDLLGRYKKAASADASAADTKGDFKRGNKRFSGIIKATKKQLANDAKKYQKEDTDTCRICGQTPCNCTH